MYVYRHDGLTCGIDALHQFLLLAQKLQSGAVVTFATVHVGDGLIDDGGTRFLVACLKIAGGGATHNQHHHISGLGNFHRLVNVGVVLVAYGTTFGISHLCPALFADAFEHGHDAVRVLWSCVVAQLVVHIVGVRPDDGHLFNAFAKGQNAIVFQQNSRLQSHLFGQLGIIFRTHLGFGQCLVNIRIFKQSEVEFQLQHMTHGAVNFGFGDETALQGFFQKTTVIVTAQVNVDTCFQGHGSCFGRVSGHMLRGVDSVDSV